MAGGLRVERRRRQFYPGCLAAPCGVGRRCFWQTTNTVQAARSAVAASLRVGSWLTANDRAMRSGRPGRGARPLALPHRQQDSSNSSRPPNRSEPMVARSQRQRRGQARLRPRSRRSRRSRRHGRPGRPRRPRGMRSPRLDLTGAAASGRARNSGSRPAATAIEAATNPSNSGCGRSGAALELGVELAGHEPRVVLELDDLDEPAVRRLAGQEHAGRLQRLAVAVVDLEAVAVPLVDDLFAVDRGGLASPASAGPGTGPAASCRPCPPCRAGRA